MVRTALHFTLSILHFPRVLPFPRDGYGQDNEWASWTYMSGDWNGGCHGSGRGGSRYYRFGMSMTEVVGRMTMYGLVGEGDERRDITNGDVHGVHYEESGGAKAWYKNDAPTGFPWLHRNPTHL